MKAEHPLFLTSPHSGEALAPEASWLTSLDPLVLLRDVDRFVDELYSPAAGALGLPLISTKWSRYVVDLNRQEQDVDEGAVVGASQPKGRHPRGLHWQVTTRGEVLMGEPIEPSLHERLIRNYYRPFHDQVAQSFVHLKSEGYRNVFHLDLHSMPSEGTELHSDPGKKRAEVVVSDFLGKSAQPEFRDLVVSSYVSSGFQVVLNDPYIGGGITQRYGNPQQGHHTLQIELNRSLYMDEETKERAPVLFEKVQEQLLGALSKIVSGLASL